METKDRIRHRMTIYGEYLRTAEARRKIFASFIQPFRLRLEYSAKDEAALAKGCPAAARSVETFDVIRAHCESPEEYSSRALLSVVGDLRGLINDPIMVKRRQAAPPDEDARWHAIEMNFYRTFNPNEDIAPQVERAFKTL